MWNRLARSIRLGGQLRGCSAGTAAAEFGLTLPFLVLLAFGAYDYGGAFVEGVRLTGAARAGAQQAIYGAPDWDDTAIAEQAALEEYVGHALTESEILAMEVSAVADTFCGCSDGTTVSCSDSCPGGSAPSRFVRVTLSNAVPLVLHYPWTADGELQLSREAIVRGR
jgi:Flp pilus assembly protein TadG